MKSRFIVYRLSSPHDFGQDSCVSIPASAKEFRPGAREDKGARPGEDFFRFPGPFAWHPHGPCPHREYDKMSAGSRIFHEGIRMRYLHTMVRVGDLDAALDFYCAKLGLIEVRRHENEKGRFTLVFLATPEDAKRVSGEKTIAMSPMVELT